MILTAHPEWSYPDLLGTPVRVLRAMDALAAKRRAMAGRDG